MRSELAAWVWIAAFLALTGCTRQSTSAAGSIREAEPVVESALEAGETPAEEGKTATAEHSISDGAITSAVKLQLAADPNVSGRDIKVTTGRGVVRLTGVVANREIADTAVKLAGAVNGVQMVQSKLKVQDQ
jgi:hyperosmotically inducible protein